MAGIFYKYFEEPTIFFFFSFSNIVLLVNDHKNIVIITELPHFLVQILLLFHQVSVFKRIKSHVTQLALFDIFNIYN